jgi:two-component system, LytTR family, response regulator
MNIRALIVDDEAPARARIATLLGEHRDFDLIGECANGPDAVDEIVAARPDVVFLDVQMPEMSGFEVVDAVGPDAIRALVFVTAYDEYALRAFDARAVDYLLKPFTTARFEQTLARARRVVAGDAARELQERVGLALEDLLPPVRERRVVAREESRVVFLRVEEIDWIEGAGNYVLLHSGDRTVSLRSTLKATAQRLLGAGFRRIHHSVIVNVERIRSVERLHAGGYAVYLETGKRLETSRAFESSLTDLL